ncbi:MAG: T9SS type A sorting domain-containing protein [Chitinophagaceae bacterium]|nr:T9SS type A sorting domain-containing protein [Chitinophagaceae bacterium]
MKKLILFSMITAISAVEASAQLQDRAILVKDAKISESKAGPAMSTSTGINSGLKTTAAGTRRYDYQEYAASISTTTFQGRSVPIWQDTTIRQNFTSGLGTINYCSVAQSLFPMDNFWNDPANPNFAGLVAVTNTTAYIVDSVRILGFYIMGNKGGAGIVDTLVVSVGSQPASNWVGWLGSTSSWAVPYLPSGKDTLKTTPPTIVDSVKRMALCNPSTTPNAVVKIPLTAAMRIPLSTASTFQEFTAAIPGGFNVPAGNAVVISYTFRSGDTWVKNSDTITERHHFRAGFAYPGTTTTSEKQKYTYYDGDRNMSSLMFAVDSNSYLASVVIGAVNDPTRWFNQYLLNSITVSCPACTLSIGEASVIEQAKVYPNPANTELNIPFTSKEKTKVTVALSNMIGQTLATQTIDANAGQANNVRFNTSLLQSGIYVYTIEANGQRQTGNVTIIH